MLWDLVLHQPGPTLEAFHPHVIPKRSLCLEVGQHRGSNGTELSLESRHDLVGNSESVRELGELAAHVVMISQPRSAAVRRQSALGDLRSISHKVTVSGTGDREAQVPKRHEAMMIDQTYTPPPSPVAGQSWPALTRTAYPMKPWDKVLEDGRIVSGALARVKAVQHEHRVVVEWSEGPWVFARRRLVALPPKQAGMMSAIFSPTPKQWGLRGHPYVWEAMRHALETVDQSTSASDGLRLLDETFRHIVGVDLDDLTSGESIKSEELDRGGMSGGWVDLNTWRTKLMPLLKSRLGKQNP